MGQKHKYRRSLFAGPPACIFLVTNGSSVIKKWLVELHDNSTIYAIYFMFFSTYIFLNKQNQQIYENCFYTPCHYTKMPLSTFWYAFVEFVSYADGSFLGLQLGGFHFASLLLRIINILAHSCTLKSTKHPCLEIMIKYH